MADSRTHGYHVPQILPHRGGTQDPEPLPLFHPSLSTGKQPVIEWTLIRRPWLAVTSCVSAWVRQWAHRFLNKTRLGVSTGTQLLMFTSHERLRSRLNRTSLPCGRLHTRYARRTCFLSEVRILLKRVEREYKFAYRYGVYFPLRTPEAPHCRLRGSSIHDDPAASYIADTQSTMHDPTVKMQALHIEGSPS